MKRFIVFFFCMVMVLGMVSAFEFDNVKTYDAIKREVTFKNSLLGFPTTTIGKARLNTPLNYHVPLGYQKVAEFDVWAYQNYNDALKSISFYDKTQQDWKQHGLNKNFDIKFKSYEDVTVDDYDDVVIRYMKNGTAVTQYKKVGSHIETREVWNKVTRADLMKNEFVTIGIFTNVEYDEHVEWIPKMYGLDIEEWASWTADLNVSLRSYYKLDGNSFVDAYGNSTYDLTNSGTTNTSGIIIDGRSFDGSNDEMRGSNNELTGTTARSFNVWVYSTDVANYRDILTYGTESSGDYFHWRQNNNGKLWFQVQGPATPNNIEANVTLSVNTWHMATVTYDGTTTRLYQDAVLVAEDNLIATTTGTTNEFHFGSYLGGSEWWAGKMDEIGIWTRALNQSEITLLNNGGHALPLGYVEPVASPSITFNSPASQNYTTSPQTIQFNFTASDPSNLTSVYLYVNGVLNQTNASGINNTDYLFNITVGDGTYTVFGRADNNESLQTDTETRTYTIDSTNPTVTITSPSSPYTVTSFNESIQINWTVTDTNIDTCWYYYPYFEPVLNNSYSITPTWNFTDSSLIYGYDVYATISNGNSELITNVPENCYIEYTKLEGSFLFPSGNTTLSCNYQNGSTEQFLNKPYGSVDTIKHITLYPKQNPLANCNLNTTTINYLTSNPSNLTFALAANDTLGNTNNDSLLLVKSTDSPNITLDSPVTVYTYLYTGKAIDLNFSISNNTIIDTCWYVYDGTTTVLPNCTSNTTFSYVGGSDTLNMYVNDTIGNEGNDTVSWVSKITENSQTFPASTIEGSEEDYTINVTMGSGYELTTAILYYGNTSVEANNIISTGQNRIISVNNFEVPNVDSPTNVSFFWTIELTDASFTNSTTSQQLVSPIVIDNCSTYNYTLIDVGLYEEATKVALNGTIEMYFNIQNVPSYTSIVNLSAKYIGVNQTQVCTNINLSGQGLAYSAEIRYSSIGYSSELYNIQKASIETTDTVSLYDLNSNDTTRFEVTYKNNDFVIVDGAVVQLLRKYISENVYEVVEAPLTSSEGKAILHIDLDSILYKAIVVKNGVILDVFNNLVFNCENELSGVCTQTLVGDIDPLNEEPITTTNDFAYSVGDYGDYITVTFSIPSSSTGIINVQLEQQDMFGNTSLCNKTVISSGGSIECSYNNNTIADSYLRLNIYKDGVPQAMKTYFVTTSSTIDFLGNNFIIVFIFLLSIVGMAYSSPEWIVINGIVVFIIGGALYLLNGVNFVVGLGIIMWLVVAAAILISKMAKQEDR